MKALRLLSPVLFVALCCRVILVAGDSHQSAARAPPSISKKAIHIEGKKKKKVFKLSSSAFPHAGLLPFDSSCWVNGTRNSGDGISPPLSWVNIPKAYRAPSSQSKHKHRGMVYRYRKEASILEDGNPR